jgi:NAD(P)-dependent dehydrogenase (short-subunit alcohol dehydrogenase family)
MLDLLWQDVGRETALQYACAGASVAIVARTRDALDETRDVIVTAVPGADVLVFTADVRDVESVRAALQSALRHFVKLDILIANAGAYDRVHLGPQPDGPDLNWPFFCSSRDSLVVHFGKALDKKKT